jgi:hypothetical protein
MSGKTFKRETAWGCLAGLWLMAIAAMVASFTGADIGQGIKVIEIFAVPVFMFAGAAFGVDWWSRQCRPKGEAGNGA